jgi:molybdenum cofactor guanylyltransferase
VTETPSSGRRSIDAIVLAGGRSQRFGRDKLAAVLDGRPLLAHAIDSVQRICGVVVVVGPVDATPPVPQGVLVVHDERPFEGPLAGLVVALRATTAEHVIVVGGDMPALVPAVADALIDELRSGATGAVLEHAGKARPLPIALVREVAARTAADLMESGERRLRALPDALEAAVIPEEVWRLLDAEGSSLKDIDTPADLP